MTNKVDFLKALEDDLKAAGAEGIPTGTISGSSAAGLSTGPDPALTAGNLNSIAAGDPAPFISGENDEERRRAFIYMIYDLSASMERNAEAMYTSFVQTCHTLAASDNENYDYRVKLVLFNDRVREFNSHFQDPEELAQAVSMETFKCCSSTSISSIISYLDNEFSGKALKERGVHKSDPFSTVVMVTDYESTDDCQKDAEATDRLLSNIYYTKTNKTLCIYCGGGAHKNDAAAIAGGADNVVPLKQDYIEKLLTPLTIASTITLSDATHVTGATAETKTTSQIAKEIIDNETKEHESAQQLTSEETKQKLMDLLCGGSAN